MSNDIVDGVLGEIRGNIGCLYKLSETVSLLDVLISFAQTALKPGFVRPIFGHHINVKDGKHPILALRQVSYDQLVITSN